MLLPAPSPVRSAKRAWPVRAAAGAHALFLLANLMLIALGLYLMGVTRALAFSERFGQKLWRHLQPLTRRYLPAQHPWRRLFRSACCGAGCPAA
jgi:sulfite exporter TauE/SafE